MLVWANSVTARMYPPSCWPKRGINRKAIEIISSAPKTRLDTLLILERFSVSANSISSSLESSSSIEMENSLEIHFKDSKFGYPRPLSHFETAVLETNSCAASCSCVRLFCFRSCCNFSWNSIIGPPVVLVLNKVYKSNYGLSKV